MKLDINQAWTDAAALVRTNADVLWALAGVFFVLPAVIFTVMYPQPEPVPGADLKAMLAQFEAAYAGALPIMLLSVLVQTVGTLTILTLFSDRSRPTVAEAIKLGAGGVLTFIGAQLMLTFAVLLLAVVLGMVIAASGSNMGVAALILLAVAAGFVYFGTRFGLIAPVITVEGQRNPLAVLQRSWALTQGNVGRILVLFVLLGIVFVIVIGLIMLLIGAVLAVTLGGEPARVIAAFASAMLSAAAQLYLIAVQAAIHRQLSGRTVETVADKFS
jgi:hypothetical protein